MQLTCKLVYCKNQVLSTENVNFTVDISDGLLYNIKKCKLKGKAVKNLIFNIYKTLFFFDFAVIVIYFIPDINLKNPALSTLCRDAASLAVVLAFTLFFTRVVEKKRIKVPFFKNKLRNYSIGLICGAVTAALPVLLLWPFRMFEITGQNSVKSIVLWLSAILFNTSTTELLLRGYLYRLYRRYYGITASSTIVALLYISLNLANFRNGLISSLNLLAMNILLCLVTEYTGSLFTPVTVSFVYTAISSFLFGTFTLGEEYPHIFNTAFKGAEILTGGEQGPQGGLILFAVTAAVSAFFIMKLRKRKSQAPASPRYHNTTKRA